MTAPGLISPADAMHRLRCTALRLDELIDAGLVGAWHDRATGAWHICAGSLAAYLRQKPTDADLDTEVRERTEARTAELVRLNERAFTRLRGLS